MFSAILFDCDGVLVDSEILSLQVEIETLKESGLHFEMNQFAGRFMGMHHTEYVAALDAVCRAETGQPLRSDYYARVAERCERVWADSLTEVRGAAAVISRLDANLPKAVASSSRLEPLRAKVAKTGLAPFFGEHVYSADQVARGKPAPDVYLYAAERIGVAPEACLVIEDSANGVLAGLAAGATVWGFTGGSHAWPGHEDRLSEAGAHAVFSSWADVAEALKIPVSA